MENFQTAMRSRIRDALLPLLAERGDRIHLIDPPDHPNVGDCAILLGEFDFLARELPGSVIRFHDFRTYSPSADGGISKASVLLIHGGGNFGDIWPHHHQFRLEILRRFRHKPIIQLPQSVYFESPDALKETQEAISNHPEFTLMVRDTRSEAFSRANFDCPVILCPDMALAMNPIARNPPTTEAFCLLRTDKEMVAPHAAIEREIRKLGLSAETADWLEDPPTPERKADRFYSTLARQFSWASPLFANRALEARSRYATSRLAAGIDALSRGRLVVTDRLHAHILSTMLGIPNVVFNSYDAKAKAFYDTWTLTQPTCSVIDSPDELAETVETLLVRSK